MPDSKTGSVEKGSWEYATAENNALNPTILQKKDSVKLSSHLQASKYFKERLLNAAFSKPLEEYIHQKPQLWRSP